MNSIRRKVITDWSKPLLDGGLGPGSASQNLIRQLQIAAAAHGFDLHHALRKVSGEDPKPGACTGKRGERRQDRVSAEFSAI